MVCCLCVDVNSAVILSWAFRREQRDIGGVPGSSLVGGPEEPSWMQRGMLCAPAVGYGALQASGSLRVSRVRTVVDS